MKILEEYKCERGIDLPSYPKCIYENCSHYFYDKSCRNFSCVTPENHGDSPHLIMPMEEKNENGYFLFQKTQYEELDTWEKGKDFFKSKGLEAFQRTPLNHPEFNMYHVIYQSPTDTTCVIWDICHTFVSPNGWTGLKYENEILDKYKGWYRERLLYHQSY